MCGAQPTQLSRAVLRGMGVVTCGFEDLIQISALPKVLQ